MYLLYIEITQNVDRCNDLFAQNLSSTTQLKTFPKGWLVLGIVYCNFSMTMLVSYVHEPIQIFKELIGFIILDAMPPIVKILLGPQFPFHLAIFRNASSNVQLSWQYSNNHWFILLVRNQNFFFVQTGLSNVRGLISIWKIQQKMRK